MDWMLEQWGRFAYWVDHLPGNRAAMLGALGLIALNVAGKYLLLPGVRRIGHAFGRLLLPVLSGAWLVDRYVALPRYLRNIEPIVGRLRNPWLPEGQPLRDIFVPVAISNGRAPAERSDLEDMFLRLRATVIVGDPGSGKTTSLKAIAMDCITGRNARREQRYVPLFLSLRDWSLSGKTFDRYVVEQFERFGCPRPARLVLRLRMDWQLVYLLDGLDEVDESRRSFVIDAIRDLLLRDVRKGGCRVYITSRPVGYQGQFSDLIEETVQMLDFTPAQIRRFVDSWDFRPPKSPARLFSIFMERPAILQICRNPLMLTIVTSLYRETDYDLPDSRGEFYRVCIEALLRHWDAVKELTERNKYPAALKEAFLEDVAFEYLSDNARDMDGARLLARAETFLSSRNQATVSGEIFIEEIVRSGLLTRLPTGQAVFAHRTFAEALAASGLRNQTRRLVDLWQKTPETWLEVCSLYVADHRTPLTEVEWLLNAVSGNPRHWAILAGEAHTCPDAIRGSLCLTFDRLYEYDHLDKRACAALIRLGARTRPLFTTLLHASSPLLREMAIHALGQSAEPWARELLVQSLTEPDSRGPAIEALAGLADEAIAVLEDLTREQPARDPLITAAIEVARRVATVVALRLVLPMIYSDSARSVAAAYTTAAILNNPDARVALDSGKLPVPPLEADPELGDWAVPWLDADDPARGHYCRMISLIARGIEDEALDTLPIDLLVPVLILDRSKTTEPLIESRWVTYSVALGGLKLWLSIERPNEQVTVTACPRLTAAKVVQSIEGNWRRILWARSCTGKDLKNIQLPPVLTAALAALGVVAAYAATAVAAYNATINPLWCLAPGLSLFLFFSWREHWSAAGYYLGLGAGIGLRSASQEDRWDTAGSVLWSAIVGMPLAVSVAAGLTMGGAWALPAACLCVTNIALGARLVTLGSFGELILWRRSNPFIALRRQYSQPGADALESRSKLALSAHGS